MSVSAGPTCQCANGSLCLSPATQEDLLCDYCRDYDCAEGEPRGGWGRPT